ncbi:MAG: type II toxin-antitoxin system mRNA interferase toxin, RelE/StbE family [Candidatus Levybacteria bacterium]|nr:type II toxin-antitoxin system mRNA interferase toxin, RelE/StbE family [Candidatus Levybacteria bacterium]
MIIKYAPPFLNILKKVNIRIRKRVKQQILVFSKNPYDPQLNNHELTREWKGFRSINITGDWRAIYTEKRLEEENIAYFVALGTHDELYR